MDLEMHRFLELSFRYHLESLSLVQYHRILLVNHHQIRDIHFSAFRFVQIHQLS